MNWNELNITTFW